MKELKQKKILGWGQSTIPDKMLVLANLLLYLTLAEVWSCRLWVEHPQEEVWAESSSRNVAK
jgi:hypothetical protein